MMAHQQILKKAAACAFTVCAIASISFSSPVSAYEKDIYLTGDGDSIAAMTQYDYKPHSLFTVYCKPGYLTDILLKKGETPTYIGAGDTSRWMIDQADVDGIHHVYIKPFKTDIETNLIINTDEHSYRFVIASDGENYTPIVSFIFTDEEKKAMDDAYHRQLLQEKPMTKKEKQYRDIFFTKQKNIYVRKDLNTHYEVKRHGSISDELYPVRIFDDGKKTYFEMSSSNLYELPVLYNIDAKNKPVLVNYRVKGPFLIADRLFEKGRLQFSGQAYLDIRSLDARFHHLLPSKVDYTHFGEENTLHHRIEQLMKEKMAKENPTEEEETVVPADKKPSTQTVSREKAADEMAPSEKIATAVSASKEKKPSSSLRIVLTPSHANGGLA